MRLYTTKHPRERFNIRWNRRKSAFRLAARGLALYIYPGPLIEWSLVILVNKITGASLDKGIGG